MAANTMMHGHGAPARPSYKSGGSSDFILRDLSFFVFVALLTPARNNEPNPAEIGTMTVLKELPWDMVRKTVSFLTIKHSSGIVSFVSTVSTMAS